MMLTGNEAADTLCIPCHKNLIVRRTDNNTVARAGRGGLFTTS